MARKKTKKIYAIIFNNPKLKKKDIVKWIRDNKKILDSDVKKIRRDDKDYVCLFRNKYRFKRTEKKYYKGAKILKGFLK